MHLVSELIYTLHLRKWEGAQMCNELDNLLEQAGADDLDGWPALSTFFSALQAAAGDTDGAQIVEEMEPVPDDEPAITEED